MRAVGVEEAAAVGPELLDDLLRRHRALGNRLFAEDARLWLAVCARRGDCLRIDDRDLVVRLQILYDALRHEEKGADDRDRQQHPKRGAHHVDPEVPDRLLLTLRDAANERDRDRDADRCRDKVVIGEPSHLGEIAHRRLAAVRLPVRVGGERDGGIERQVRRDRAKPLRVQRQNVLHALHHVEHQQRDDAEHQDGDGVLRPPHLARVVDAGQLVDEAFERPHHRIEPGLLAREHPRHEAAEDRRHGKDGQKEDTDLQPAIRSHVRTSPASSWRGRDTPAGPRSPAIRLRSRHSYRAHFINRSQRPT